MRDMWLPDEGAAPGSRDSRGVVTHEYGHFTMCSLLFAQDGPPALDGLIPRIFESQTKRTDEVALMTESWADTFASQVVGGTNYVHSSNSVQTGYMGFCIGSPCMDFNYRGLGEYSSDDFYDELARFESLIYDAFDRTDSTQRFTDAPGNGDVWNFDAKNVFTVAPAGYIANHDENVSLSAAAWSTWVTNWLARGEVANENNVIGGLVDTMAGQGANWCDRCELLAIHDKTTAPSAFAADPTNQLAPNMTQRLSQWHTCTQSSDIQSWLGAPPNAYLNMDATCTPCPLHSIVNASGVCEPCPAGSVAGNGKCTPCEYGASDTTEWCVIG
jgi:hypothetical protein